MCCSCIISRCDRYCEGRDNRVTHPFFTWMQIKTLADTCNVSLFFLISVSVSVYVYVCLFPITILYQRSSRGLWNCMSFSFMYSTYQRSSKFVVQSSKWRVYFHPSLRHVWKSKINLIFKLCQSSGYSKLYIIWLLYWHWLTEIISNGLRFEKRSILIIIMVFI